MKIYDWALKIKWWMDWFFGGALVLQMCWGCLVSHTTSSLHDCLEKDLRNLCIRCWFRCQKLDLSAIRSTLSPKWTWRRSALFPSIASKGHFFLSAALKKWLVNLLGHVLLGHLDILWVKLQKLIQFTLYGGKTRSLLQLYYRGCVVNQWWTKWHPDLAITLTVQ